MALIFLSYRSEVSWFIMVFNISDPAVSEINMQYDDKVSWLTDTPTVTHLQQQSGKGIHKTGV